MTKLIKHYQLTAHHKLSEKVFLPQIKSPYPVEGGNNIVIQIADNAAVNQWQRLFRSRRTKLRHEALNCINRSTLIAAHVSVLLHHQLIGIYLQSDEGFSPDKGVTAIFLIYLYRLQQEALFLSHQLVVNGHRCIEVIEQLCRNGNDI